MGALDVRALVGGDGDLRARRVARRACRRQRVEHGVIDAALGGVAPVLGRVDRQRARPLRDRPELRRGLEARLDGHVLGVLGERERAGVGGVAVGPRVVAEHAPADECVIAFVVLDGQLERAPCREGRAADVGAVDARRVGGHVPPRRRGGVGVRGVVGHDHGDSLGRLTRCARRRAAAGRDGKSGETGGRRREDEPEGSPA